MSDSLGVLLAKERLIRALKRVSSECHDVRRAATEVAKLSTGPDAKKFDTLIQAASQTGDLYWQMARELSSGPG